MAGGETAAGVVLAINPHDIRVGKRLRPVDQVWAAALGKIMDAEGQKTPIDVCRMPGQTAYDLVCGAHRLEGAILSGLPAINAIVVSSQALHRREREISENLWRKGLDPIDRAAFVAELYALQKAKAGLDRDQDAHAAAAAARWQKVLKGHAADASVTVTLAYGWANGTAEKVGLSRETIYRDLALHRNLLPDVADQLRGHPIASSAGQLRALAKLGDHDQRAAAAMIVAGDAKGVSDAMGIIEQRPKPSPDTKAWSAFFGGWSRMSAATKREALRHLAGGAYGLPHGFHLVDKGSDA